MHSLTQITKLEEYTRASKREITSKLCKIISERLSANYGSEHINQVGPQILGALLFQKMVKSRQLPSLMQLIQVADRLNMRVVLRLTRPSGQGFIRYVKLDTRRDLLRMRLVSCLEDIFHQSRARLAQVKSRQYQWNYIDTLREADFRIDWLSLIRFCAVCGYELQVSLEDFTPAI